MAFISIPIILARTVFTNTPIVTSSHQNEAISLLFTTYHDIRLANLSRHNGPAAPTEIIVKDLPEAGAFDFFYAKRLICWNDQMLQHIQCMKWNGTQSNLTRNVILTGLDKPEVSVTGMHNQLNKCFSTQYLSSRE